jgi:hypothetical protein
VRRMYRVASSQRSLPLLVVLLPVLMAACTSEGGSSLDKRVIRQQTAAASPSPAPSPTDWAVTKRIALRGSPPFKVVIANRYVWVLQRGPGGCSRLSPCVISRIDPEANRVVGDSTAVGDAWDLTVGAGSVWVTRFDGRLLRIDERTGRVESSFKPPTGFFGHTIAFGARHVWGTSYSSPDEPASLVKIDPTTDRIVDGIDPNEMDARTQSIAVDNAVVWLGDHDHNIVSIDARTLDIKTREPIGFVVLGIAVTKEAVILADSLAKRLAIVDVNTGTLDRTATLPIAPNSPVIGGGSLWTIDEGSSATSTSDDRAFRIDLSDLTITETVRVGGNPSAIDFGHGSAWVALRSGHVVRLDRVNR